MDGELQRGYTGEWDALKKLYDASVWNQDRNGYQDTLLQTHPPDVYDGILATWVRGENGHINKQESSEMIMTYFEEWGVRSFMGATPAALALYSVGSTTGVGVDIGEGGTSIVPVYEGYTMPHAVCHLGSCDLGEEPQLRRSIEVNHKLVFKRHLMVPSVF